MGNEKLVERAYYRRCSGVQIPLMAIPKIFAVGLKALEGGATEAAMEEAVVAFVQTIRVAKKGAL